MPNSFDQNIRAALEKRLIAVTGLPIMAPEGVKFRPTIGVPFVEPTILVISERPASIGDAYYVLHEGEFIIVLAFPNGQGMGAIEAMANLVKEEFRVNATSTANGITVRFRYAEKRVAIHEPEWIR